MNNTYVLTLFVDLVPAVLPLLNLIITRVL